MGPWALGRDKQWFWQYCLNYMMQCFLFLTVFCIQTHSSGTNFSLAILMWTVKKLNTQQCSQFSCFTIPHWIIHHCCSKKMQRRLSFINLFMNNLLADFHYSLISIVDCQKAKSPAYGRQRVSRPMRIVGPIQFWRGCVGGGGFVWTCLICVVFCF